MDMHHVRQIPHRHGFSMPRTVPSRTRVVNSPAPPLLPSTKSLQHPRDPRRAVFSMLSLWWMGVGYGYSRSCLPNRHAQHTLHEPKHQRFSIGIGLPGIRRQKKTVLLLNDGEEDSADLRADSDVNGYRFRDFRTIF